MPLSGLKPAGSIRFGQYDQVIHAAIACAVPVLHHP